MCDCGCEDYNTSVDQSNSLAEMQSLPRVRRRVSTTRPMAPDTSIIDARRVLTYEDENEHSNYPDSCRYNVGPSGLQSSTASDSLSYIEKIINLTGGQGIAIVQRQPTKINGTLNYADAVRRQSPHSGSRASRKCKTSSSSHRQTSCCPSHPRSANSQNRGCCSSNGRF